MLSIIYILHGEYSRFCETCTIHCASIYTSPDAVKESTNYFILSMYGLAAPLLYLQLLLQKPCCLLLQLKGHGDEVMFIACTLDRIVNLKHPSARQTTLHDYFTH